MVIRSSLLRLITLLHDVLNLLKLLIKFLLVIFAALCFCYVAATV